MFGNTASMCSPKLTFFRTEKMREYTATIIDTTGIQPYIFGSNRLRENIGASFLIAEATKQWVEQALIKLGKPFYFPDPELSEQREELQPEPGAKPYIEDGNLTYLADNYTLSSFKQHEKFLIVS